MLQRFVPTGLAVLALVLATALCARADSKTATHKGLVVSVEANKLTMSDVDGKNLHSHMIPNAAAVTCDGKVCRLQDLKKGMHVVVTTEQQGNNNVVTLIEAMKSPAQ